MKASTNHIHIIVPIIIVIVVIIFIVIVVVCIAVVVVVAYEVDSEVKQNHQKGQESKCWKNISVKIECTKFSLNFC